MDLTNKLKLVETGSTVFETSVLKSNHSISGNQLKFTKASRTDLTSRPFGNLFTSFNLPILDVEQDLFQSGGTFYNTAIQGVNVDDIIVIEIPKNQYGELIDGKSISLSLPINTGSTDEIVNIFGTYFSDSNENTTNGNIRYSDASNQASYFGIIPSSDNDFNSNVTFLFSNRIKTPQLNTGTTWDQWTSVNKFSKPNPLGSLSNKQFAVYSPDENIQNNTCDQVVGIAYLDKGFFVITDPTIVNNFVYSSAISSGYNNISSGSTYSGSSDFTQIYFNSSISANSIYSSIKTEFVQNVYALALGDEFFESENPTFLDTYADGNPNNEPVYVTEIGLYNENNELIAIGKTSEPIPKTRFNTITFNVKLKL